MTTSSRPAWHRDRRPVPGADPAPGLGYGSLDDERRSATRRLVLGIPLLVIALVVAVVLVAS